MMKNSLLTRIFLEGFFPTPFRRKIFGVYDDFVNELSEIVETITLSVSEKKERLQNLREEFSKAKNIGKNTTISGLKKLFDKEGLDSSLYTDMIEAYNNQLDVKKISIWEEFLAYGRKKSSPIARLWMAVYRENPSTYLPAENLCLIWQIMDVLNSLKTDQGRHNLCLIPSDLIKKYQAYETDFSLEKATPEASKVISEILSRLESMQADIQTLPSIIRNKRLRFRVYVILSLTNFMIQSVRKRDILQCPCILSFRIWAKAFIHAVYNFLFVKRN